MTNLKTLKVLTLLKLHAAIIDELRRREVVRTGNSPISDYAEKLVADTLGLALMKNANASYDAKRGNARYQIKARRITARNKSRQLGVIRNLGKHHFDYLVAILFNEDFSVKDAYRFPYSQVKQFASANIYQNGHILHVRGDILKAKGVKKLTKKFI